MAIARIAILSLAMLASTSSRVELGAHATTVTLHPKAAVMDGRKTYLVLRGLTAENVPGIVYDVYVDLPRGVVPKADDPHYAGTINFYAALPKPTSTFISFEVTKALRSLRRNAPVTITFIPSGALDPEARPAVARIELVAQ